MSYVGPMQMDMAAEASKVDCSKDNAGEVR